MSALPDGRNSARRPRACHPPLADHETGCASTTCFNKVGPDCAPDLCVIAGKVASLPRGVLGRGPPSSAGQLDNNVEILAAI